MRALISLLVMVSLAGVANAQYSQPPPGYQQYPPPGYTYAPPAQLTLDEQYLMQKGYITEGQHIGGGVVALFFGYGIGQAIQGRWSEKGYIFTLGDAATAGVMMYGMVQLMSCIEGCSERDTDHAAQLMLVGALGHLVFRTWETIDAFTAPGEHNRKLRALHMRLGMQVPVYTRLTPHVAPPRDGDGAVAGLSLRF